MAATFDEVKEQIRQYLDARQRLPVAPEDIAKSLMIEGSCIVHSEAGDIRLEKDDALLLERGKTYRVEATYIQLALPTPPTWYPEQFKIIEE